MNKRKEKLRTKIGSFIQQYGRKSQKGQEPNDRGYSRKLEARLKRMKPEELDELLNGVDTEEGDRAPVKRTKPLPPASEGAPERRTV